MAKLVIDMMGSDLGSEATKQGVVLFHKRHPDCELVLVGKKEELSDLSSLFRIIEAGDVVTMDMGALEVIRKKESSMVEAISAVGLEKADGVVSAGGTGAFLSAATLLLKKIPGVRRPALVTGFPNLTKGGFVTLLDVGASNANTPEELAQFALMGSLYSHLVFGIGYPLVKLLANGTEEGKGSPEGKEAFKLLAADKKISFGGNIEASQVLTGAADVVVTDGFTGNVLLKATEGTAKGVSAMLKKAFKRNLCSMTGYLLSKKGLQEMSDQMNPKKIGGALLIGVNGIVVKAHGNSDGEAFASAIGLADRLASAGAVKKIEEGLREVRDEGTQ
jgi:glycerol-3-phosphate acyltransferase PlsX